MAPLGPLQRGWEETLNWAWPDPSTRRTILQRRVAARATFQDKRRTDDDEGESSSVADDIRSRTPCIATYIS